MSVTVIVPARDAEATLPATLAALAAQRIDEPVDVVVVDNGSLDRTAQIARAAGVRVVSRERGQGPGAARTAGARAAQGERLAFVDADCRPDPEWLATGLRALADADLVQGAVRSAAGGGPFDRRVSVPAAGGLFEAANLFARRALVLDLGGFPAGLEGPGQAPFGEDALFGWAAVRSGARVRWCPRAVVEHVVVPRGARAFIVERARLALFPELVAQIPELREQRLYARWFLTRRSAAFDAALVGLGLAAWTRRPRPLSATLPYLAMVAREALPWGPAVGGRVAVVGVAADAVGAWALTLGSLRSRSPLL